MSCLECEDFKDFAKFVVTFFIVGGIVFFGVEYIAKPLGLGFAEIVGGFMGIVMSFATIGYMRRCQEGVE